MSRENNIVDHFKRWKAALSYDFDTMSCVRNDDK